MTALQLKSLKPRSDTARQRTSTWRMAVRRRTATDGDVRCLNAALGPMPILNFVLNCAEDETRRLKELLDVPETWRFVGRLRDKRVHRVRSSQCSGSRERMSANRTRSATSCSERLERQLAAVYSLAAPLLTRNPLSTNEPQYVNFVTCSR